jgi:hypothetical protein
MLSFQQFLNASRFDNASWNQTLPVLMDVFGKEEAIALNKYQSRFVQLKNT